jgi:hypothetical protein
MVGSIYVPFGHGDVFGPTTHSFDDGEGSVYASSKTCNGGIPFTKAVATGFSAVTESGRRWSKGISRAASCSPEVWPIAPRRACNHAGVEAERSRCSNRAFRPPRESLVDRRRRGCPQRGGTGWSRRACGVAARPIACRAIRG